MNVFALLCFTSTISAVNAAFTVVRRDAEEIAGSAETSKEEETEKKVDTSTAGRKGDKLDDSRPYDPTSADSVLDYIAARRQPRQPPPRQPEPYHYAGQAPPPAQRGY